MGYTFFVPGAVLPIDLASQVSNVLPVANGGTALAVLGAALEHLRTNAAVDGLEYGTPPQVRGVTLSANEAFPAGTVLTKSPGLSGLALDAESTYIFEVFLETDNNAVSRDIKFRFAEFGSGTFSDEHAWRKLDADAEIETNPLSDTGIIDIDANPHQWRWIGMLRTILACTDFSLERANGNDTGSQTLFEGSYISLIKID